MKKQYYFQKLIFINRISIILTKLNKYTKDYDFIVHITSSDDKKMIKDFIIGYKEIIDTLCTA